MSPLLSRCAVLAALASTLLSSAEAVTFPVKARYVPPTERAEQLSRRSSSQSSQITISDFQNAEYTSLITAGGGQFTVQLDTGSSDLNLIGTVSGAQDTEVQIDVEFAEGADTGVMSFASVTFAGTTISNQIFNHLPASDATQGSPDQGLLGLGPSEGSVLWQNAQELIQSNQLSPANAGDSLLDRIFQQDTSTPNFMSFTLSREDTDSSSNSAGTGTFTVGDVISGFENITSMPKLDVVSSSNPTGQHWTIQLDGVTGNNGNAVTFPASVVPGVGSGKLLAVLDSGFTLPQLPSAFTNAFYASIPNAQLTNVNGVGDLWILPCNQEVNGAFIFQGQEYPIHPLDLNSDPNFLGLQGLQTGQCVGLFQPIQDDATSALGGLADMILGMAFLRNTYTLMNFGDFVDSSADARQPPYVQLLSVTDAIAASNEFNSVRNANGSPPSSEGGDGQTPGSSSGGGSGGGSSAGTWIKQHIAIIVGIAVGVIVLIALFLIFCCVRRRRARRYQSLAAPPPQPYASQYAPPSYQYGQPPPAPYGYPQGGQQRGLSPNPQYQDPFRDHSRSPSVMTGETDHIPMLERTPEGRYAGGGNIDPYHP